LKRYPQINCKALAIRSAFKACYTYLQQFEYQLKYCPSEQNVADYLSRHMLPLIESNIQTSEARKLTALSLIQHPVPSLWLIFK